MTATQTLVRTLIPTSNPGPLWVLGSYTEQRTLLCQSSTQGPPEHSHFQAKHPLSAAVPPTCSGFHTLMSDGPSWNVLAGQCCQPCSLNAEKFALVSLASTEPGSLKWSCSLNIQQKGSNLGSSEIHKWTQVHIPSVGLCEHFLFPSLAL